ncbi:disease resistance protein RGA5-like [Aegilops tauschii subsp. strangulata]|uniref:Disease resistance protein RPP13 n=1 Tax=Aegilops tauschii subsp. strangulata TaxID=200361 RepID=A0A453MTY0_AEGTS|nr:disease resistance protein RGA5-like [Aegilops tauschii subsp. strangulata]
MAASATTGALYPLLGKLTQLLGEEYKKLTGVRKQASFLKDELSAMKALLDKMELMDKLDSPAKNWRDDIREMSYDMENCIDDFIHDIEEGARAKKGFPGKMAQRLRRLIKRHQIANRIQEFKGLAEEANARRKKYNIDECINSSPKTVAVDRRMTAIYKEAASLVGIDGPREELVSLLMDSQMKLKVVSIVGFGGLGKTTLAKQVYDEVGEQFDYKAFFSVSQRPEVKSLLVGLQLKLGMKDSSHAYELQDIIDCLREHLKHKRYFIVVDDLWDQQAWDIISCAFPDNSTGSRVMVTTRLDDVAVKACQSDRACIYRMKPLKEQDSRKLFFDRVFGSENVCPSQLKEISVEILRKCGGLPLAIITIASLLASHEARLLNEWEIIKNSLGTKFVTKPTLEEMRGILNLSYMHLPVYLRPCFLYLGMYPEDREIERDDLVRQWIAEGFVCSSHRADLDDVAKSYFNELVNRSMIQPGRTSYGEVLSCRVHDMMLDLILSKSTEDNFISVAYNCEDMARLHSWKYKVRRLSLQSSVGGATSETLATSMTQVRSYVQFTKSQYTPPLSKFKYLRVLAFEFPSLLQTTIDLTAIGHLFLLRYLKVSGTYVVVAFPAEIQGLVHLETLVVNSERTESFPSDISCLPNLFHLVLPRRIGLPKGIKKMRSIRTLSCWEMSESSLEDIKGLSELTNLRELYLSMPLNKCLTLEQEDALVSSIRMLRDLKCLELNWMRGCGDPNSQLYSLHGPPRRLEVLHLPWLEFRRVPTWIGELCCLRMLDLKVLHLSCDEFRVLGELPSLVYVKLYVVDVSQDKVVVGMGLFPVLEHFYFECAKDVNVYLSFEAGAMPKVQTLSLNSSWGAWRGATPVGMECLPCLHKIKLMHVWPRLGVHAKLESAFKGAVSLHPRHPSVTFC